MPASAAATASAAADVVARAGADAIRLCLRRLLSFFRLRSHSIAFHARKPDTNTARKINAPQKSVSMSKSPYLPRYGRTAYISIAAPPQSGRQYTQVRGCFGRGSRWNVDEAKASTTGCKSHRVDGSLTTKKFLRQSAHSQRCPDAVLRSAMGQVPALEHRGHCCFTNPNVDPSIVLLRRSSSNSSTCRLPGSPPCPRIDQLTAASSRSSASFTLTSPSRSSGGLVRDPVKPPGYSFLATVGRPPGFRATGWRRPRPRSHDRTIVEPAPGRSRARE